MDVVAVIVVEEKHVSVARAGGLDEAAREVGEALDGDKSAIGVVERLG